MAGWVIPLIQGIISAGQGKQAENNQMKPKPVDFGAGLAKEVPVSSGGGGGGFLNMLLGSMSGKKKEETK